MKEKFRVKFLGDGWGIQYSLIGIFWKQAGELVYGSRSDAVKIAYDLSLGEAPGDWFTNKE